MSPLKPQFMGTAKPCAVRRRLGKQDIQLRRRQEIAANYAQRDDQRHG
jgi:hypothetical protein